MKLYKTLISTVESSIPEYNDGNDPEWFVIDLDQSLIDMIKYQARHLSYTNAFSIEVNTPYGNFLTDEEVDRLVDEDVDQMTERGLDGLRVDAVVTEGVYIKIFKDKFMFTANRHHTEEELDFFKTNEFKIEDLNDFKPIISE